MSKPLNNADVGPSAARPQFVAVQFLSRESADPTIESEGFCANCGNQTYTTPGRRPVHDFGGTECPKERWTPAAVAAATNANAQLYQDNLAVIVMAASRHLQRRIK